MHAASHSGSEPVKTHIPRCHQTQSEFLGGGSWKFIFLTSSINACKHSKTTVLLSRVLGPWKRLLALDPAEESQSGLLDEGVDGRGTNPQTPQEASPSRFSAQISSCLVIAT